MVVGAFDDDADRLWFQLREADANIDAWIHVGGAGYRRNLCQRYGNFDGLTSISATGAVSPSFRNDITNDLYRAYRQSYVRTHNEDPSQRADLAASGVYMLVEHVLPGIDGEATPESIRQAIMELNLTQASGMMGEGLAFADNGSFNEMAGVIAQQQQNGAFCSAWPDAIATCSDEILPFPTWRERALANENYVCPSAA